MLEKKDVTIDFVMCMRSQFSQFLIFNCDRRLTLADVSRYTNAQSLINRTVFDLDSIIDTTTHSRVGHPGDANTVHQQPKGVDGTFTGMANTTLYEPSRDGSQTFASSNPFNATLITSTNNSSRCANVAECHGPTSTYPNIDSESLLVEEGVEEGESTVLKQTQVRDGEIIPHLCIDSCFESGNLRKAIQASYMNLVLQLW